MAIHRAVGGLGSVAVLVMVAGQAMGQVAVSTPIALTGHTDALGPAGAQAGTTFVQLNNSTPTINNLGQVLYRGQGSAMAATGGSSLAGLATGTGGVWLWDGSANLLKVQMGDATPAPDSQTYNNGATGGGFTAAQLGGSGTFTYSNAQTGATASSGSTFVYGPTSSSATPIASFINRISGANTNIAAFPTAVFSASSSGTTMLNSTGQYLLGASLTNGIGGISSTAGTGRNDSGLWIGSGGTLTNILQRGKDLTALPGGVTPTGTSSWSGVNLGDMTVGSSTAAFLDNGTTIWRCQNLVGTGISTASNNTNNASALMSVSSSGALSVIARSGDTAPGTPAADQTTLFAFGQVAANNSHLAFNTGLRNGAATITTSTIYSNHITGGGMQILARKGNAVPASLNYGAGVLWGSATAPSGSLTPIAMSSNDTLLVSASGLTGGTITGNAGNALVLCDALGNWSNVAHGGDVSPAISPTSGAQVLYSSFSSSGVNALNQVAFIASLSGTGIDTTGHTNDSALFVRDSNGTVSLVAQLGTAFQVAPGDVRTVATGAGTLGSVFSVALGSGGQDGRANSLNDFGQLTFGLRFTDGSSGIFVTNIPGPGAGALLGLGGLIAARRRRR